MSKNTVKIIFIDNQDSFTYNLVEELQTLNFDVDVYRNTLSTDFIATRIEQLLNDNFPCLLFLSPGPGTPSDSPTLQSLISKYRGKLPILGICLGHQALAESYGAKIDVAGETVHGKSSNIQLTEHTIFSSFGNALQVARYHSLVANEVPASCDVIAQYQGLVMAIINEEEKVLGFQFHPESILTTKGSELLEKSINYLMKDAS